MTLSLAVALLSAAALGFEVLLVRLFAIIHWHHFAFMIISLALLGYGASGTVLFFLRRRLIRNFERWFLLLAVGFAISVPITFALTRIIPLNSLEILWNPHQFVHLAAQYGILALPFLFGGGAIGLALFARRERIALLYRADLIGAGGGAVAIVAAMLVASPVLCLKLVSALAISAACLALPLIGEKRLTLATFIVLSAVLVIAMPDGWLAPRPSEFKPLSQALQVPERTIIAQKFGPLGLITAVSPGTMPFRHVPGLSLAAPGEAPEQFGLFIDGEGPIAVTRFDPARSDFRYLDFTTAALPYHLLQRPRVLILGAGGGGDILLSLQGGAAAVDALEADPQVAQIVTESLADLTAPLFRQPGVSLHVAEARQFLAHVPESYDLVSLSLIDSLGMATGGMGALSESGLYTVEALALYLNRLTPGGLLAVTRWLRVPPRDSLKLVATAADALAKLGVDDSASRIAVIRGLMTTTLIVKREPLSPDDLGRIRAFCHSRRFDIGYLPGAARDEVNRFNVLDRPYLFEGATALLGPGRRDFLERYKFDLRPATDDRPFFHHFLTWQAFRDLLAQRGAGIHLLEWGVPIAAATLTQAVLWGGLAILLPLAMRKTVRQGLVRVAKFRFFTYFLGLGLAFIMIELAFIPRFSLFLGSPVHAVAGILASFLVSAGIGSGLSSRLADRLGSRLTVALAVLAIVAFAVVLLKAMPGVLEALQGLSLPGRMAVTVVTIAPLALFMGMPFPLALQETGLQAAGAIPWAWAINGCASVVGAAAAPLFALWVGFSGTVSLALALYLMAATVFLLPDGLFSPGPRRHCSGP